MTKKVVLISCVSKKQMHSDLAEKLYISSLFKLNLSYAKQLRPDAIHILSAEHGVLSLNDFIEPYDKTLNTMSSNEVKFWANEVTTKLQEMYSFEKDNFVFLAGKKYRQYIIPKMRHFEVPLEGLKIGYQLQRLKELIND